jgi:hypothetical protein
MRRAVLLVQRIRVALIQPSASPATCPAVRVFFGVVSQGTRDPVRWRSGPQAPWSSLFVELRRWRRHTETKPVRYWQGPGGRPGAEPTSTAGAWGGCPGWARRARSLGGVHSGLRPGN